MSAEISFFIGGNEEDISVAVDARIQYDPKTHF